MAKKTLADVVEQLEENNDKTEQLSTDLINLRFDIHSQLSSISLVLESQRDGLDKTVDLLANILNLQLDDSDHARKVAAEARERAREASRLGDVEPAGAAVPDGKAEEAKAGGFFSRMGKAIMNPVGAMGKSMKSMGKGIGGFLKGLAGGLAAFANPMVLVGVTVLSISLPIFAAGLAAAFKVFEMIAGQGSALALITGIITSLGEAIGTILQKVLEGFGNMVKNMGPFITKFFEGIAIVIKALEPIIVSIWSIIKDIITDPTLNKTIQALLGVVGTALKELSKVIQKVGDVIIAVVTSISGIIDSVFNGISKLIKTIGDAIIGIIDKIVEGIERLAVLPAGNMLGVAAGLLAISAALVTFSVGAAIAGAFMPSAETLESIAKSIERFGAIDSANLAPVGKGMQEIGEGLADFGAGGALASLMISGEGAEGGLEAIAKAVEMFGEIPSDNLAPVGKGMQQIGAGLLIFGVGQKLASLLNDPKGLESVAASVTKFGLIDATNFAFVGKGMQAIGDGLKDFGVGGFISGLAEGFGKWIGASDPVEKFQKFAKIGPELFLAGQGVTALAKSFDNFDADNLEKIGDGLDKFLGKTDMKKLKEFSLAAEGLMTGKMLAELQIQANQAAASGTNITVQNNNSTQVNQNQTLALAAAAIQAGTTEKTLNG